MTSLVRQRWQSRQLVGDSRHALIVRVRPGHINRGYLSTRRIDDGSTPFNGSPIFPPLIVDGHNHDCWQGEWVIDGPWQELPNIESAKWTRDFDVQTGASKGTSTCTVVMDNIDFPEETGLAGIYHAIVRGYFSPERGIVTVNRANLWPDDVTTIWTDALNAAWQVELWEGYGIGADIELLTTLDPTTNSYAPTSGALDRTWTGIIVECDTEAHPDKITLTARDFGILFTDQRIMGHNKAPECRSPITFADRKQTDGEIKITGPYNTSSGSVTEDGNWTSGGNSSSSAVEWIEITLPAGYYTEFYVAPAFDNMEMFVSLWLSDHGTMDSTHPLPAGWVDLGAGSVPGGGPPYLYKVDNLAKSPAHRWSLGHGFDVSDGSRLRLSFTNLPSVATNAPIGNNFYAGTNEFDAYKYGSAAQSTSVPNHAKGWILVEDAAEIARMVLIWAGFKEWHVEDFGWTIHSPMVYGEDKFFMDTINDMLQQGLFIFYMGPPTNDDRSIGVPHFEHATCIDPPWHSMLEVRDTDMVEALEVKWDLSSLPWVIRYRGAPTKNGQLLGQDLVRRYMATYYPPWAGVFGYQSNGPNTYQAGTQIRRTAGIHRHFSETMGITTFISLTSNEECLFACILAAFQYALGMITGQFQMPGLSRLNLNDQMSVVDEASAVNSRMWLASIESDHQMGESGYWRMNIGGSLMDSQEFDALRADYQMAWQLNQAKQAAGPDPSVNVDITSIVGGGGSSTGGTSGGGGGTSGGSTPGTPGAGWTSGSAGGTYTTTIIPLGTTAAGEIPNPLRGQYIWNGIAADPSAMPDHDVYYRDGLHWSALEPSAGVYDFTAIDNALADAAGRGGRLGFRIMAFSPGFGGNLAPSYIPTDPANSLMVQWNNSIFLNAWHDLMAAIGAHCGSDSRLGWVDIGGYGSFGEWHLFNQPGTPITEANMTAGVIQSVISAFPDRMVMAMTANNTFLTDALSMSPKVGVRVDCLGAPHFCGSTVENSALALARWQTALFATEWCNGTCGAAVDEYATAAGQVDQFHISLLSSGNYPQRFASMSGADQANFIHANLISGYRYQLDAVNMPSSIASGAAFTLVSSWENANVAPTYDDWTIKWELKDGGGSVVWSADSDAALKNLLPTGGTPYHHSDALTMGALAAGSYTLAVRVVDPSGYLAPLRLAITGRQSDGSYDLGAVTIT